MFLSRNKTNETPRREKNGFPIGILVAKWTNEKQTERRITKIKIESEWNERVTYELLLLAALQDWGVGSLAVWWWVSLPWVVGRVLPWRQEKPAQAPPPQWMTRSLSSIVPSYPNIRSAAAAPVAHTTFDTWQGIPHLSYWCVQLKSPFKKNARNSKYFGKAIAILNAKSIFLFHMTFVWIWWFFYLIWRAL